MRNFRVFTGQAMAATASLLLMTACGGGSDGGISPSTTSTSSTAAGTTTSTEATTTSTEISTTSTTTTTLPDPFNLAAATLVVQHSLHCMTATNTAGVNDVRQAVCATGNPAQNWEIKPAGTDYTIRNSQSNLCLRVNDAALSADPLVLSFALQGPCDGSTNTLWNFQQSPTAGQFNVIAKHSGLCLDVPGSEQAPGTAIIQYTCNTAVNQPNQRWVITPIAP